MITQILSGLNRPINEHTLEKGKPFEILLPANVTQKPLETIENQLEMVVGQSYNIKVKKYMTQHATTSFNFMQQWNNDKPMPFIEMSGKVIKETRGMFYMELSGLYRDNSYYCMRCGRPLTNNVSILYGLGPECGSHAYINPYDNEQDLAKYVEENRIKIRNTTWSGWIIKSAIIDWKEL